MSVELELVPVQLVSDTDIETMKARGAHRDLSCPSCGAKIGALIRKMAMEMEV